MRDLAVGCACEAGVNDGEVIRVPFNVGATTTLIAPAVPGKRARILSFDFNAGANMTVTLVGVSGSPVLQVPANGNRFSYTPHGGYESGVNTALSITTNADCDGYIAYQYVEEQTS